MSNIKVIDVNNEEAKQEEPTEQIEEVKEETKNEVVGEITPETNEVIEEVKEEPKQETKPVKAQDAKPCVKTQDKLVRCPKCNKEMKLKSYRYGHEKTCGGTLEQKPVKPFSKPRAKPKAQPIVKEVYEEEVEVEEIQQQKPKPKLTQEVSNQILKPQSPNLVDFASHYQLLQNQFIQQKKEKYNSLCQNMFSSKSKKR